MSAQAKNKYTENFLRAVEFRCPEWIPCRVGFPPATWMKYGEELERIVLEHLDLFPGYFGIVSGYKEGDFKKIKLLRDYRKGRWKDIWGIVRENIEEGIASMPIDKEAPLKNWEDFKNYKDPSPLFLDFVAEEIDWGESKKLLEEARKEGNLACGSLVHGFMYMYLYYLRGFTNLMMDIATKDPRLDQLIEMVLNYNLKLVDKWVETGAELVLFGDDLGHQKSLPISPSDWRRYLKPCYAKIFGVCQDKEVSVYLHSDGHFLEVIEDLIECGVNIINLEVQVNGLVGLEEVAKGKVCIDASLDRQLFPFASRQEIRSHIWEVVKVLSSKEGGLMLSAYCTPDVPLEIIETICQVLEEVRFLKK